jgi:hypothetical protein
VGLPVRYPLVRLHFPTSPVLILRPQWSKVFRASPLVWSGIFPSLLPVSPTKPTRPQSPPHREVAIVVVEAGGAVAVLVPAPVHVQVAPVLALEEADNLIFGSDHQ